MELDDAYDNLGHIPGAMDFPPRWEKAAQGFRDALVKAGRARLDMSYGPTARQSYDLFFPEGQPEGLCVFVHGGYWRRFHGSVFSHLATGMLARDWAVAMASYDLCPDVRIREITRQIASMVTHVAKEVAGPIALIGHSAGGHLVARLLEPGLLPAPIAVRLYSMTPISPVSDLRPLLQTSMNSDFRLTPEEAQAESPVLMKNRVQVPVHVWVGASERPAFLDQARWLSEAWDCPLRISPSTHHLDVIDVLLDPNHAMVDDILG
ncbi:MAG: alpha/beta hydrolase [Pseudomonadota bacterium]